MFGNSKNKWKDSKTFGTKYEIIASTSGKELTRGEENLGEVNTRRGIFQGDSLSPLLFVVCLLPLTHILWDVATGYHFAGNGQKVNLLLFMDNLTLYTSNEKSLDSLIQTVCVFSTDTGMEFGV